METLKLFYPYSLCKINSWNYSRGVLISSTNWHSPSDASLIYILIDIRENTRYIYFLVDPRVSGFITALVCCDMRCKVPSQFTHSMWSNFQVEFFFPLFTFSLENLASIISFPLVKSVGKLSLFIIPIAARFVTPWGGGSHQVFKRFLL